MPPRYMIDTDVFIYIRSRKSAAARRRFEQLEPGEAVVSVITLGELLFGAEKSSERERGMRDLQELTAMVPVMTLSESTARSYGAMRARLEARGQMIGGNDLWIAAHAASAGLILVTNNEREFKRLPELKTENWTG